MGTEVEDTKSKNARRAEEGVTTLTKAHDFTANPIFLITEGERSEGCGEELRFGHGD